MNTHITPYGSSNWSENKAFGVLADDFYVYGNSIEYERGWCQVGYFSHWFETEAAMQEFISQRTPLEHIPPYRQDDGALFWMPGEVLSVGMLRIYNEQKYRCIQAHTTQSDWTPDVTTALWETVPNSDEWIAGAWYGIGTSVLYNETWYKVLQSHTSQEGWQPPNVPALFEQIPQPSITPDLPEWMQPNETPYALYDVVQLEGIAYQNIYEGNWWHPSVYGWRILGAVSSNPCDGVQQWDSTQNWTEYTLGDLRTWNGKLYKCINTAWAYLEPGTTDGALGWEYLQDCNL